MKKIFLFIITFFLVFGLFSCVLPETENEHVGEEYSVTFIVKDKVVELEMDSYISGEEYKLPVLDDEDFLGWYETKNGQNGKSIEYIKESDYGDKIFYAKMDESIIVPPVDELANALNIFNYGYNFKYIYTETSEVAYDFDYEVDVNNFKYSYDYLDEHYTDLFFLYDEEYYLDNGDGSYELINGEDFTWYVSYLDYIYPEDLDASKFTKVNENTYAANDDYLEDVGYDFFDYASEELIVGSFEITLKDGKLYKVVCEGLMSYDDSTELITFEVTFSNIDQITIVKPTNVIVPGTIIDAYYAEDGDEVTVSGIVCGIVGNNMYISDGEYGVYLYFGNAQKSYYFGDEITVTGTVADYKGLIEIKNIYDDEVLSKGNEITPSLIDSFEDAELYLSMNINAEDVIVTEVVSYSMDNKDMSYKVSDGNTEITLFISKHLSSDLKNSIKDIFTNLKVGDVLSINNAVISCFNDYQIAITENTTVEAANYEVTGISLSSNEITVKKGTDLIKAANLVTVYCETEFGKSVLKPKTYNVSKVNDNTVCIKYKQFEANLKINFSDTINRVSKTDINTLELLQDVVDELNLINPLPPTGSPNILVVPIAFSDSKIPSGAKERIENCFFGTSTNFPYGSLKEFYYNESMGKLNITGKVSDIYTSSSKASYYDNLYHQYLNDDDMSDPCVMLFNEALSYLDDTYDFSEFDTNEDGYFDGIAFVYLYPYDYDDDESMFWAFTELISDRSCGEYDGLSVGYYAFMSYDFFDDPLLNDRTVTNNTETIIHEFGHVLGLDDYYDYDYDYGKDGGLASCDMMDSNCGEHNPYSKMLLGWIDPYIINSDTLISIDKYNKNGDVIVISNGKIDSVFSEYYLIYFYTIEGYNEYEANMEGAYSIPGIRVLHVDAVKMDEEDITDCWYITEYDNSYTDYLLIDTLEADNNGSVAKTGLAENGDLFQSGSFINNLKWNDGSKLNVFISFVEYSDGGNNGYNVWIDFE